MTTATSKKPEVKSKHEQWIEDIQSADGAEGGIKLSQWEAEFVENIEGRIAEGRTLTEGQADKLEQIGLGCKRK